VVKCQTAGDAIKAPDRFLAPDTVAVYSVPACNALDGTNVAVLEAGSYARVPETAAPAGPARVSARDPLCTGMLIFAVTLLFRGTLEAWSAGCADKTVGRAVAGTSNITSTQ